MNRFTELDGLRGVLALMVVLSHVAAMTYVPGASSGGPLDRLWQLGAPAVDGFFVLSGFVVAHALLRQPRPYLTYLRGRARRLLPLAYVGIALGAALVPAGLHLLRPGAGPLITELNEPVTTAALLSALSGTLLSDAASQFNPPLWSLHVELLAALLMPALVWAVQRGGWVTYPILTVVGLLLTVLGAPAALHLGNFTLGALLAVSGLRAPHRALWPLMLGGLALLMIRQVTLGDNGLLRIPSGLGAGLILLALTGGHPWAAVLRRPAAQHLGHASYALYVTHFPVMFTVANLTTGLPWWTGAVLSAPLIALVAEGAHRAERRLR